MVDALTRAITHPPRVTAVGERSPLAGLARRRVGFLDVLAQSVSAVAPSAAATTIPSLVAAAAGAATVLAIAAAMVLALLVGATVNVFTRRMASTGSLYTFVAKGLGPGASFMTGAAMVMGYGFISVFALAGGGYYLALLVGHLWSTAGGSWLVACALVVATGLVCLLVLIRGIRLSTRITLLIEVASLMIIVTLVILFIALHGSDFEWSVVDVTRIDPSALAAGAALGLTAFVGFESAASLGVEARRPFASIPRALIWTVIVAGVIFLLSTYSQVVGFDALGRSLTASTAPVNELAGRYGIGGVGMLLDASIAFSFVACAIASMTALVRLLFSMARDSVLPSGLGRTHRRFRTPAVAVAVTVPLVTAIPLVLIVLTRSPLAVMQFSIVCAATGYIVSYVLVCLAAPAFLRRIDELAAWPVVRAITAALLLSIVLVVYLGSESASLQLVGVIVAVVFLLAAGATALITRWREPERWRGIGSYDEAVQDDLLVASMSGRDADTP